MYELMANDLLIDHLDEFEISVYHSYLQVHQNPVVVLLMYPLQIVKILHVQPDQNFEEHARTTESVLNSIDICDTRYLLLNLLYRHLVNRKLVVPIPVH